MMIIPHKVWVIAKTLLLSQLRTAPASRMMSIRSLIRRPSVLGVVDLVGFLLASGIAYYAATNIVSSSPPDLVGFVSEAVRSALVILPLVILSVILVLGLVVEVSAGAQFASSDTVNWLPVTASEYVAASTLSLLIYYSVLPVVVLGAMLSLSYVFGEISAWELATVLSILGVVVSTSALEIVRAILNRFSSSFYRRGGRAAVALRALFGVAVVVLFQALFYPTFYERFLGVITPSFGPTWFVPILWASVSVVALLSGNLVVSTLFGLLTVALATGLFFAAVEARSRYWVPMPPSIRISSAAYAPKKGFASAILSPPQLAIAKKDLRGLIRRREMVRLLALPGVFIVISILGGGSGGFSFSVYFGLFIVCFATLFFSVASVGSEGKSIINLYQSPVAVRDFVVGKAAPPIVFGSVFGVAFYVVIGLVSPLTRTIAVLFLASSVGLAFEGSFVGLLIGMRFPNFSESPRSSFMSQTAGLIAFPVALTVGGLSLGPLLAASVFNYGLSQITTGFGASILIVAAGCYIFYSLSLRQARKLLSQLPV